MRLDSKLKSNRLKAAEGRLKRSLAAIALTIPLIAIAAAPEPAHASYLQKVSSSSHASKPKRYCSQGVMCGNICVSERYACSASSHPIPHAWPKPKSSLKTKVARN